MTFHSLDYAVVGAYFAFLVVVGITTARGRRKAGGGVATRSEDFLIAGRTLSLPAFVATLVATWYGGILGVGELSYTSGLGTWTVFGLPYYLFAVVYALFLAHRVRGANHLTIPDTLAAAHGKPVALLGAILVFCLVTPAPYVLMLGTLLHLLFGWSVPVALAVGTFVSVVFVVTGGFRTDIRTNIFQFILMFASFALIDAFAVSRGAGIALFAARLPAGHQTFSGGMPLGLIIVWYFIALWTLVDPGFHQRCSAARDSRTARNGILLSVACWAVFDFLTIFAGLSARAFIPSLDPPLNAYPALSQLLLPPGAKGFFWVGMLATVMSTVLSYTFIAAITLGRDIFWRAGLAARADDVWWTRVGVALTALLSVAAALLLPSVVGLWYTLGTAFVPGLLIALLTCYVPPRFRARPAATFAGMILGTALPVLWMLLGYRAGGVDTEHYPFHLEPLYLGLAASTLCCVFGRTRQKGEKPGV